MLTLAPPVISPYSAKSCVHTVIACEHTSGSELGRYCPERLHILGIKHFGVKFFTSNSDIAAAGNFSNSALTSRHPGRSG